MLSRVQELDQLYILEELIEDKIYANHRALAEIDRLIEVSINKNPSDWDKEQDGSLIKISFLNCRSMKNKFEHVKKDKSLLQSTVIVLTETWLEEEQNSIDEYDLTDYQSSLNSIGRGRGIASYYKNDYKHATNINIEGISFTKLESEKLDVIAIYRSQEGNVIMLIQQLESLITEGKTTVVGGDFNICALANPNNYITQSLKEIGFKQIVWKSIHVEGGLIDHIYLIEGKGNKISYSLEIFPKYYSDHDGLGVILTEEQ